jgi:DNA invertase Pin-like site-specific DNA recombinase
MSERKLVRCAIYTRKSSDEGLEQDFNSLDAQREACAAYIASQKHEGWVARSERYDDGGFSGGSMERPGLTRLMEDVQARCVDVIIVYKVDRLTRSLTDFAKIVEVLDAQGASFVAVTQQFNTTTSMGRLTLNVLLSFAQFEREIAGERIRDKIRASRQKGMWMGGTLPIGYRVQDRALLIDEPGAALVRNIFRRYLDLKSVPALANELRRADIRSPRRTSASGRSSGDRPLSRGNLYSILANRAYIGLAVHKGTAYPGLHQPIIDKELWDRVQTVLAENRVQAKTRTRAAHPSLLAGVLFDDQGERLTPTHADRNGRRFQYYVSRSLITQGRHAPGPRWRLPAAEVDRVVLGTVRALLTDPNQLLEALALAEFRPSQITTIFALAREIAERLEIPTRLEGRMWLHQLLSRIQIADAAITIDFSIQGLRDVLGVPSAGGDPATLTLTLPVRFTKRRVEQKIMLANEGAQPSFRDEALLKAVARAHHWFEDLKQQRFRDLAEIARNEQLPKTYVHALIPLAFLAPSIVTAIVKGTQPPDLTLQKLVQRTSLAIDWPTQRQQLGFES